MHPATLIFILTGTATLIVVGEWQAALVVIGLAALFIVINYLCHHLKR